jgi:hypothetical protein
MKSKDWGERCTNEGDIYSHHGDSEIKYDPTCQWGTFNFVDIFFE